MLSETILNFVPHTRKYTLSQANYMSLGLEISVGNIHENNIHQILPWVWCKEYANELWVASFRNIESVHICGYKKYKEDENLDISQCYLLFKNHNNERKKCLKAIENACASLVEYVVPVGVLPLIFTTSNDKVFVVRLDPFWNSCPVYLQFSLAFLRYHIAKNLNKHAIRNDITVMEQYKDFHERLFADPDSIISDYMTTYKVEQSPSWSGIHSSGTIPIFFKWKHNTL